MICISKKVFVFREEFGVRVVCERIMSKIPDRVYYSMTQRPEGELRWSETEGKVFVFKTFILVKNDSKNFIQIKPDHKF